MFSKDRSTESAEHEASSNSTSFSDKRVRILHPGKPIREEPAAGGMEHQRTRRKNEAPNDEGDQQGSSSSSESRNNVEVPQNNGQAGFVVPAVVSEYSSSRTGSSGASNANAMSTSGSGSTGNTGSGTASGSNQGGSSGSGNDQEVVSSNGNGSSAASSNYAKGSSEETGDNSAENNSGEANSDETNSNNDNHAKPSAEQDKGVSRETSQKHHPDLGETTDKNLASPTHHNVDPDAARERKLQDKKRKRQIMRREYEEKVQQEMESSEGSRGHDEMSNLKPGKPVTLDKVLAFTKIPR